MNKRHVLVALALLSMLAACAYSRYPELKWSGTAGTTAPDEDPLLAHVRPVYFGHDDVRCLGKALVAQGFSGGMDEHTAIEYLGDIKAEAIIYSIYFFSHVDKHGSYRILMMENGCSYFGSYDVEDRPIRVVGKDIVFDAPEDWGNVIHFSGISPPARVIINGDDARFGL